MTAQNADSVPVVTDHEIRDHELVRRAEDAITQAVEDHGGDWREIVFCAEGRELLTKLAQMRVMAALQLRKAHDAREQNDGSVRCPSCGHRDPTHYVGIYGDKPCSDPWHGQNDGSNHGN